MEKTPPQEARLMERLQSAEAILKDVLQHDGGAYDLEPRQSAAIMAFLGGASGVVYLTPAQQERAAGGTWAK